MQTKCPNCSTLFRVTEAQLDMADGMVRCGFCKEIFNARAGNDQENNENQLNAFNANQPEGTESFETLIASDANKEAEPGSYFSDAPDGIINTRPYSTAATVAWSLAILILIAALAAEYIWFNQPQLLQDQRFQSMTAILCEVTDCTHLQKRDPAQIEMVSRNVYSHPNEKNALMVSTTLVNHASYAQPYPDVQIDFSNVRGELVASRRFKPDEYLQPGSTASQLFPTGNQITLGLEIRDPGREAITYEFSFH